MAGADRGNLSRERIARAAIALVDQNGPEGLSMRRLGAELGVEAMSLYHYVQNKDDLLDEVMGVLYSEIHMPRLHSPADWEQAVRQGLNAFHQVLVNHPGSVVLFPTRATNSPQALAVLRDAFEILRVAGLEPREAFGALHFAISYILGHASDLLRSVGLGDPAGGESVEFAESHQPHRLASPSDQLDRMSSEELFAEGSDFVVAALRARFDLP